VSGPPGPSIQERVVSNVSIPERVLVDDGGELCALDAEQLRARCGFELTLELHFADDEARRAIARDAERAEANRDNRKLLERHAEALQEPARLLERVYVGDAGALGRGLFAVDALPPNSLVAIYSGEVMREPDADPDDPYVVAYHRTFRCPNGLFCRAGDCELDLSARRRGGLARFINGSKREPPNLQLQIVARDDLLWPVFTTTRPVRAREQLRWDYGEAYWAHWARVVTHQD
jgi:SET domain-containing protein